MATIKERDIEAIKEREKEMSEYISREEFIKKN